MSERRLFILGDAGGDAPIADNDNDKCCGMCDEAAMGLAHEPCEVMDVETAVAVAMAEDEAVQTENRQIIVDNIGEILGALVDNHRSLTDLLALYAEVAIND